MTHKTINLLPPSRRVPTPEPLQALPSVIVTLCVASLVALAGVLWGPQPKAAAKSVTRPNPSPRSELRHVSHDDAAATAIARASGWFPWHELFAEIPEILGEDARLKTLTYKVVPKQTATDGGTGTTPESGVTGGFGTVVLSGEIERVSQVAEIMLSLENVPWLAQPVPQTVQKDDERGTTHFSIDLGVQPFFTVEEQGGS